MSASRCPCAWIRRCTTRCPAGPPTSSEASTPKSRCCCVDPSKMPAGCPERHGLCPDAAGPQNRSEVTYRPRGHALYGGPRTTRAPLRYSGCTPERRALSRRETPSLQNRDPIDTGVRAVLSSALLIAIGASRPRGDGGADGSDRGRPNPLAPKLLASRRRRIRLRHAGGSARERSRAPRLPDDPDRAEAKDRRARRRRGSPAVAVHDLVERPALQAGAGPERPVRRIAEIHHERDELPLGNMEDRPR